MLQSNYPSLGDGAKEAASKETASDPPGSESGVMGDARASAGLASFKLRQEAEHEGVDRRMRSPVAPSPRPHHSLPPTRAKSLGQASSPASSFEGVMAAVGPCWTVPYMARSCKGIDLPLLRLMDDPPGAGHESIGGSQNGPQERHKWSRPMKRTRGTDFWDARLMR